MVGVALDFHRAAILDGDAQRAGVGTVVRTGAMDDADGRG